MKSILIYNPESGQKNIKKHLDFITKALSSKYGEIECIATTHAGEAKEIADRFCEASDYIFVAGGDGTVSEVVGGLALHEKKPILGILPLGTINDVAHSVGIYGSIKKVVKLLDVAEPADYDIFKLNQRFGIYVCCAGLFSKSSYATKRKSKKIFGKIAYFACGVKEIFSTKPVCVKIETETETIQQSCSLLLAINSKSVAGFRLNKKAKLDDGKVELVIFKIKHKKIHFIDILRVARAFLFGIKSIKNKKYVDYRILSNFKLTAKGDTQMNIDGENSHEGSFEFNVINKGVQILTKSNVKKS